MANDFSDRPGTEWEEVADVWEDDTEEGGIELQKWRRMVTISTSHTLFVTAAEALLCYRCCFMLVSITDFVFLHNITV